jgi:nucleoside-diphosphate-sugar epimerase
MASNGRINSVSAAAIAAIWAVVCAIAVLISGAGLQDAALPAVAGWLAVLVGTRRRTALHTLGAAALLAAALLAAAITGPEALPWLLAGAAAAVMVPATAHAGAASIEELQRHLMRCRRRGESAAVVRVELPAREADRVPSLLDSTRATDSFAVKESLAGVELIGLLDGEDVQPELVEQRFGTVLDAVSPTFGWARFPDDGVTLDVLIERARESARGRLGGAGPRTATRRADGRIEPAMLRRVADAASKRAGSGIEETLSDELPPVLPDGARVLVTGAAGFIGSHLCERLVASGYDVVGVDCFTDFYPRDDKERNLAELRQYAAFYFHELDLSTDDVGGLLEGVDTVFHLAAQPGVRTSFGDTLNTYLRHNVLATQRLLEAATGAPLKRFVYASSSSVYGNPARYPTTEHTPRRPVSPYGMTKVATEDLAGVYHRALAVPTVGLRYFTAYGPRQRPDMAFSRFLTGGLAGQPIAVMGDGRQVRDFTYVGDVVGGTIAAAIHGRAGSVYNIGGGQPVELREAVGLIEQLVGRRLEIQRRPAQVGDVRITGCDGALARDELGYLPSTSLRDGLVAQLDWMVREAPDRLALARVD